MLVNFTIWFFAILNILGTILNIKMNYWAFVIWTACNIFWLIYDFFTHQNARIIMDVVNLSTSAWGMIEWYSKFQNQKKKN